MTTMASYSQIEFYFLIINTFVNTTFFKLSLFAVKETVGITGHPNFSLKTLVSISVSV